MIPVFCDQSEIDFNINLDQVEEQAKKDDVKGLMLIHTYGLSANMDRVLDICQKNNITLIEDTCESMGANLFQNLQVVLELYLLLAHTFLIIFVLLKEV